MTESQAAWRRVGAACLISCASVAGQMGVPGHLNLLVSYVAAGGLFITAVVGRRDRRIEPPLFSRQWLGAVVAIAFAYLALGTRSEASDLAPVVPLLFVSACAEEIIFRDDLLCSLRNTQGVLAATALSQSAFALSHIPALLFAGRSANNEFWFLVTGITVTFSFGCLTAGMRYAGVGTPARSAYHAVANMAALAAPVGLGLHAARLLGVAMTMAVLFAGAKWLANSD